MSLLLTARWGKHPIVPAGAFCEKSAVKEARSHFPKELLKQVKAGLNQRGFHVLGRNELHEICGFGLSGFEKLRLVHQFAAQCDAECEIGLDFAAAQFLPKRIHPQMVRLLCIAELEGVTVTDGDVAGSERRLGARAGNAKTTRLPASRRT